MRDSELYRGPLNHIGVRPIPVAKEQPQLSASYDKQVFVMSTAFLSVFFCFDAVFDCE